MTIDETDIAARRAKLEADLATLNASDPEYQHPSNLPDASAYEPATPANTEPKEVPESVLANTFRGVSLGTWLARMEAIFQSSYASNPHVASAVHTPATTEAA